MVVCNSTLSETHWAVDPIVGNLSFHTLGWIICIGCTVISCAISLFLIYKHATTYTNRDHQRNIIRILFMVPVYSVTTMFSYVWYWHAVYWEFARDCYEAFCISAFFVLMCHYIAPDLSGQKEYFVSMEVDEWPWPLNWWKSCTGLCKKPSNGLTWFNIIWISIFQYCFIRVATTIIATTTQYTGHYCEDSLHPAFAHFWVMFLNCLAVTVAMYMLIAFYMQMKTVLRPNKPLLKLLCIKLVIFFSFWQMIVCDFLSSANIIKPNRKLSQGDISVGFNALLTCFEMIIFAIMHIYAFPWKPYYKPAHADYKEGQIIDSDKPERTSVIRSLADVFNPWDIVKAFARGMRWMFWGFWKRTDEIDRVRSRIPDHLKNNGKQNSLNEHDETSEAQRLVNNRTPVPPASPAVPSTYPTMDPNYSVYLQPQKDELTIQHPAPDQGQHVPQEIPKYGLVETNHEGSRIPSHGISLDPAPPEIAPEISHPKPRPLLEAINTKPADIGFIAPGNQGQGQGVLRSPRSPRRGSLPPPDKRQSTIPPLPHSPLANRRPGAPNTLGVAGPGPSGAGLPYPVGDNAMPATFSNRNGHRNSIPLAPYTGHHDNSPYATSPVGQGYSPEGGLTPTGQNEETSLLPRPTAYPFMPGLNISPPQSSYPTAPTHQRLESEDVLRTGYNYTHNYDPEEERQRQRQRIGQQQERGEYAGRGDYAAGGGGAYSPTMATVGGNTSIANLSVLSEQGGVPLDAQGYRPYNLTNSSTVANVGGYDSNVGSGVGAGGYGAAGQQARYEPYCHEPSPPLPPPPAVPMHQVLYQQQQQQQQQQQYQMQEQQRYQQQIFTSVQGQEQEQGQQGQGEPARRSTRKPVPKRGPDGEAWVEV
ncbi:organic solute transporter Ostalpha-domain-containing protein [Pyronema domesticum]|uniref:Similar to Transmembrane protein 184 homolog DDB_G0284525 acc. no. Q54PI4 n=1 Tax=Pyronema omphalodes (strain CBS 100304) TaxID=1076935 RepID=U4L3W6_PYROM|nr:organic solute transporter Ostalpha-domain-containing protein [Pyronema domesticum]CCX06998.1 Similar to Transmembrane protein 184 homolog DDB_G0284525; acc. no. Q54PI4 [Pyronema omphalodes CBS 100304]